MVMKGGMPRFGKVYAIALFRGGVWGIAGYGLGKASYVFENKLAIGDWR